MPESLSNFDVLNFVNRIILVKHFEYMKNNLAKSVHKSLLFYDRLTGENWWRTIIKGVRDHSKTNKCVMSVFLFEVLL